MIVEGFKSFYLMDILFVMGVVEVFKDIKKFFVVCDGLVEKWIVYFVDVFIGIDVLDFNLCFLKSLK